SEEFKEHYINKPYGDVWHKMLELAYTTHPYRWMTIGKELSHIENATLEDVKAFFFKHYTPNNAILTVAGNISVEKVKELAEKWFAPIPAGEKYVRNLPQEPKQTVPKTLEVKANVPLDALYKCWHIYPRTDKRYYTADLIGEILGGGASSRLFQSLIKEKKLFSNIDCSHTQSTDAGLLIIEGKLVKGVNIKDAEKAIDEEIKKIQLSGITDKELEKVKNKTESMMAFEDMSVMNRAASIAMYELLGDADLINKELERYQAVTVEQVLQECKIIFDENNCNTLYYLAN
ncbi:M16 family metallopeptidase, partial [Ferruginibacter sp.]